MLQLVPSNELTAKELFNDQRRRLASSSSATLPSFAVLAPTAGLEYFLTAFEKLPIRL